MPIVGRKNVRRNLAKLHEFYFNAKERSCEGNNLNFFVNSYLRVENNSCALTDSQLSILQIG